MIRRTESHHHHKNMLREEKNPENPAGRCFSEMRGSSYLFSVLSTCFAEQTQGQPGGAGTRVFTPGCCVTPRECAYEPLPTTQEGRFAGSSRPAPTRGRNNTRNRTCTLLSPADLHEAHRVSAAVNNSSWYPVALGTIVRGAPNDPRLPSECAPKTESLSRTCVQTQTVTG